VKDCSNQIAFRVPNPIGVFREMEEELVRCPPEDKNETKMLSDSKEFNHKYCQNLSVL
jgi:hypothetical protein